MCIRVLKSNVFRCACAIATIGGVGCMLLERPYDSGGRSEMSSVKILAGDFIILISNAHADMLYST